MNDGLPDVRVGDVWRDNDKRSAHRGPLYVTRVEGEHVFAVDGIAHDRGFSTRERRFLRRRFKPNSAGYTLVRRLADAPDSAVPESEGGS